LFYFNVTPLYKKLGNLGLAHLSRLSVDTVTTEAGPPIVHFDGWEIPDSND